MMDSLREQITSFLGLSPRSAIREVRVLGSIREDGFQRKLVRYVCCDGEEIEAFLLDPGGPLRGAVLALHQHNSRWTIGKSEIAGLTGDPFQAFGPPLARQGVMVLALDAAGFESRMKPAKDGINIAPKLEKTYSTAEG